MSKDIHARSAELPSLPPGWVWATLGQLLREPLRNGHSAKASETGDGVRTLTLSAVTYNDFSEQNTKLTVAKPENVDDLWLKPGDIFIERSNTPELVGTAALYRGPANYAIFPDLLIRVRLQPDICGEYLEAVLQHHETRRYFRSRAQGIAGSMPKIDQNIVEGLPIPLAPLSEQRRIVAKLQELVSDLDAGVAALKQAKANLRRYRASLLKAAVAGKLTEEWRAGHPDAEPASALLKRILAERRRRWEADQLAKFTAAGKTPPKDWQSKYVEPAPVETSGLPQLPQGWCWAMIDHLLAEPTCNGISVKGTDEPPGIAALRLSAMTDQGFDYAERRYIPISEVTAKSLAPLRAAPDALPAWALSCSTRKRKAASGCCGCEWAARVQG